MQAFWRHGYESTSIGDLRKATGLNAPSLYAAFGDKRGLFRAALARYRGDPEDLRRAIDDAPTARDAAAMLIEQSVLRFTGTDTPRGCLVATATASVSAATADLQEEVASVRSETERLLRERIERDVADGVLDDDADAASLAALVVCTITGLSTLARDGADRGKLQAVVAQALAGWPLNERLRD